MAQMFESHQVREGHCEVKIKRSLDQGFLATREKASVH
jgi:hypothetical protein